MDRIVTIKMAAYFFSVVGSASLCAMELEVRKSKDYSVTKKALLCTEIMKKYEVPQDVVAIIKGNRYLLRMDTVHKKFDPFFRFNEPDSRKCFKDFLDIFKPEFDRELCLAAQKYAHENCRKFDVVTPQHLFFFTESHDDILVSLISRQGCFVHDQGNFRIELTLEEREKYLMLPTEFRDILNRYPRSYVDKK